MAHRFRPRLTFPQLPVALGKSWAARVADLALLGQAKAIREAPADPKAEEEVKIPARKPGDAYREWFWKNNIFDLVAYQFYKATEILAPGMDAPADYPHTPSERQEKYDAWLRVRFGK